MLLCQSGTRPPLSRPVERRRTSRKNLRDVCARAEARDDSPAVAAVSIPPEVARSENATSTSAPEADGGAAPVYKRRQRYKGKNPRHFSEKYKEHNPDKYRSDVEHIMSRGATPAGSHRPIAVNEILSALDPKPGQVAVDCTLGYGGHSSELLARVLPGGRLFAFDVDPLELPRAEARLRRVLEETLPEGERAAAAAHPAVVCTNCNYAGAAGVVLAEVPEGADCVLADLGLSSMQIDNPDRGFTYKWEGPLDLRMNPTRGQPASALLAKWAKQGPAVLEALLVANADEEHAGRIARAICAAAGRGAPPATTTALAQVVRGALADLRLPKPDVDKAITRTFQAVRESENLSLAIRIEVNDEYGALDALLAVLPQLLRPGGRAAVLTFHSGEDRRVKHAFRDGQRGGVYREVSDVIRPSMEEQRSNPRSACAKLRVAVRSDQPLQW